MPEDQTDLSPPVTLAEMISDLKREIAMRCLVYPGMVVRGRMKQADAERNVARMHGALQILLRVQHSRSSLGEEFTLLEVDEQPCPQLVWKQPPGPSQ